MANMVLPAEKQTKSHLSMYTEKTIELPPLPSLTIGAAQVRLNEHRVEVRAGRLWGCGCVWRGGERRGSLRFCFCDASEGDFVRWFSF